MQPRPTRLTASARLASPTLGICFLAAMLEGLDLQSTGVAAPRLGAALHLGPELLGVVFSIGTLGLLPGAMLGGRLADRVGRKAVLIGSMLLYGVLSAATPLASTLWTLEAIRFLTGVGLGAALPNLIALVVEAVSPDLRSRAVSIMYAGLPLGGVAAAFTGLIARGPDGWHAIFYLGGLAPVLLIPLIMLKLPAASAYAGTQEKGALSFKQALFAGGRRPATLLLWFSYFFTLLVVYLLLNWLPSLLMARGLTRPQAGQVQIVFNIGAALGSLGFGLLLDRRPSWVAVVTMYTGVLASLLGLILTSALLTTGAASFAAGFFVVGGQLVLYALAPRFYHTAIRGTGVGAAVGIGRIGAVAGPAVAGAILGHGHGAAAVLASVLPGLALAAFAALALVRRATPAPA